MIQFERRELPNGMRVIVHQDNSTPMVAINVLYQAGSKYDPLGKTGLAHLFEHLMFSGTKEVPDFDIPIQLAGGENNAFTNADYASYYTYGPHQNLELFLWLEADRLKNLHITEKKLEVQKQVVVEELYESCLNIPYGDVWHYLLPSVYEDHPYGWPTIGMNETEIGKISYDDIQAFKNQHYRPNQAILSMAGKIKFKEVWDLLEKWFSFRGIQNGSFAPPRFHDGFGKQHIDLKADVPVSALYLAFPMSSRTATEYYTLDLLSDLMATGSSSLLHRNLVKEKEIFTQIDAYITGTIESGLYVIEGKLSHGIDMEEAQAALWNEIENIKKGFFSDYVMQKLLNSVESSMVFSEMSILNKALNLGFYELIGDPALINSEVSIYQSINKETLIQVADQFLVAEYATSIRYEPA